MLPDRVSNPGPLTNESGALPISLRGPALTGMRLFINCKAKSRTYYATFYTCDCDRGSQMINCRSIGQLYTIR